MPIEVNGELVKQFQRKEGRKKIATFTVATPPHIAYTDKGQIQLPKTSLSFPTEYTRINPKTQQTETWRYFENKGLKVEGGVQVTSYTPEDIIIERGQIKVNLISKPDLYEFLVNDPRNQNSEMYDAELYGEVATALFQERRSNFLYQEVKEAKTSKQKLSDKTKIAEFTLLIQNEERLSDINAYALYKGYNLADSDELYANKEMDVIRERLIGQMEANPAEFEKRMNDAALTLRARIADAVTFNVVEFKDYTWRWHTRLTDIKKKDIVKVQPHEYNDKEDILLDFLRTSKDGVKFADIMKDEIVKEKKVRGVID